MVARRPPDAMTWPLKNVHLVAIGPLNMDVPYNPIVTIVHIIVPMKMAADLTKHCGFLTPILRHNPHESPMKTSP